MTCKQAPISTAERAELLRLVRAHDAAHGYIRDWLKTVSAVTPDEQLAILDLLEVSLQFNLCVSHQLLLKQNGQAISVDLVLSLAESAMLRACALQEQLCSQYSGPARTTNNSQCVSALE